MEIEKEIEEIRKKFSTEFVKFYLAEIEKTKRRNIYEKLCEFAGKYLKIRSKKIEEKISKDIIFSDLNVLPYEVISLTLLTLFISFFISLISFLLLPDIGFLFFLLPFVLSYLVFTYPSFLSKVNKIQMNGESVKAICYMVLYLENNPVFEGAIYYAAEKLKGILGKDFKKLIWDVQTGRFKDFSSALRFYIPKWIEWNENFVRALLLLSSINYIRREEERKNLLSRTLNFILEKNLEETKVYVERIKGPITILFLFGMLMPAIGLVVFPIISLFLQTTVKPSYLIIGYLVILPSALLFFIHRLISLRPGAVFIVDISRHPKLPKSNYVRLFGYDFPIIHIAILIFLIISFYSLLHFFDFIYTYYKLDENKKRELVRIENSLFVREEEKDKLKVMEFGYDSQCLISPFSSNVYLNYCLLIYSFLIPLAFGIALLIIFYFRSFQKIKIRNEIKDIEEDLPNLLITIGNFLEQGNSIEICLEKGAEEYKKVGMENKPGYKFLTLSIERLKKFGISLQELFFGKDGMINFFPSHLLEESLKILIDVSKKSVITAGKIAKTVARYLNNILETEFRLKELLSDVRGNLKMQASFLIPIMTAILTAAGVFIANILAFLYDFFKKIEEPLGATGAISGIFASLIEGYENSVPLSILFTIISLYNIINTVLMSFLLSGIENGFDEVARDYEIYSNLKYSFLIYNICALIFIFMFFTIYQSIVGI